MIKSKALLSAETDNITESAGKGDGKLRRNRLKKLVSMGKTSVGLINDMYSPLDSVNRFINLALHYMDENSQGRHFLLESKQGVRETSFILKRLNNYARKIEEEIREISTRRK